MKNLALVTIILLLFAGCSNSQQQLVNPSFTPGPPTYVYKTTANFTDKVPVGLSDDQQKIVSYPHPSDLKKGETLMLPTQLAKGYWLDNRGIGPNTVFIDMTYEQYNNLENAPTVDSLMAMILDKKPFKELYNCGNRSAFNNAEQQINELIKSKQLKKRCKKVAVR